MAALARDTKTIRLGQIVTCNSYRPPALLAKMAAGIDVMSRGRLIVGMGAGWYEHEYRAYGYDFPDTPDRLRMLREALKIMRMMWTEDRPVFAGKYYRIDGPICEPKPIQTPLPLWIGGSGEQVTLKLVAQLGDACNVGGPPETLLHKFSILRGHCEALGRDYESITRSSNVAVIFGDAAEVERVVADTARRTGATTEHVNSLHVAGDAETIASALRERAEAGVQYFIIYLPNGAEPGVWKHFAEEVFPLVEGGRVGS
jgi:alkanesulfonate monooxygenase SsuD/methylene tetrahydromethanopterin reductase-like flavin-dependent oxidoreductase (luciferase family)